MYITYWTNNLTKRVSYRHEKPNQKSKIKHLIINTATLRNCFD